MMKLGTQSGFAGGLGLSEAEAYKTMAQMGFESVDYSLMNWYPDPLWQLSDAELKTVMEKHKKLMHDNGIVAGQTHSPMDQYWNRHPETKEARWHAQIQAIKAASYLESPYIVIHPMAFPLRGGSVGVEEAKELNMNFFNFLKPYLEEYNVKAALENIPSGNSVLGRVCESTCSTAAALIDYVDTLASDRFVVCLDVGHAAISGQDPVKMIYELGSKYLHVTHIHDNSYLSDDHMMPGMGKLDWYGIGKALNDVGYDKVFNYEADDPYVRLGPYGRELTLPLLRTYVELGKAIIRAK